MIASPALHRRCQRFVLRSGRQPHRRMRLIRVKPYVSFNGEESPLVSITYGALCEPKTLLGNRPPLTSLRTRRGEGQGSDQRFAEAAVVSRRRRGHSTGAGLLGVGAGADQFGDIADRCASVSICVSLALSLKSATAAPSGRRHPASVSRALCRVAVVDSAASVRPRLAASA
jgi:hypothetical protein